MKGISVIVNQSISSHYKVSILLSACAEIQGFNDDCDCALPSFFFLLQISSGKRKGAKFRQPWDIAGSGSAGKTNSEVSHTLPPQELIILKDIRAFRDFFCPGQGYQENQVDSSWLVDCLESSFSADHIRKDSFLREWIHLRITARIELHSQWCNSYY